MNWGWAVAMMELSRAERQRLFSEYVNSNSNYRVHPRNLVGLRVEHELEGLGIVTSAEQHYIWFVAEGKAEPKQYDFGIFQKRIIDIDSRSIQEDFAVYVASRIAAAQKEAERVREEQRRAEESRARWAEEAAARAEFHELKRLFGAEKFWDNSPLSPLFLILKAIHEGDRISSRDENFLEESALFRALATYYEGFAHRDNELSYVARASRFWRRAGDPKRALDVTTYALNAPTWSGCSAQTKAPVLTTRGAALRDLGELVDAERCARAAIELAPHGYHPFNLLGGIYYGRGLPEEGDEYFAEAVKRGSRLDMVESTIRSVLTNTDREAQRRVAAYLLRKDLINGTDQYSWAQRYL